MHFFWGNDDLGVFMPTCGLGASGNGRGAGTVHISVSPARSVDGSTSSADSSLDNELRST